MTGVETQRVYDDFLDREIEYLITAIDPESPFYPATDVGVGSEDPETRQSALNINRTINSLLSLRKARAIEAYLVEWKDRVRVPKGLVLGEVVVRWTQHGLVTAEDGKFVGTYDRLRDCDGPDRDENLMAIFLD